MVEHSGLTPVAKVKASPALRLLLSFWGRACLGLIHTALYKLARIRQEILSQRRNLSPAEYHQWQEMGTRLRDGPVELQPLAAFAQDISDLIKKCVSSNGISDDERMVMERGVVITGTLPECWSEVLEGIFEHALPKLMEAVNDGVRVFSAPSYWQGPNDRRAFDVVRKTPLTDDGGPLRQCVRCKSLTDIAPGQRPDCHALGSLTKSCICGGAWILLNRVR